MAITLADLRTAWRDARATPQADTTERRRRAQRSRAVSALQSALDQFLTAWEIRLADQPVSAWHSELTRQVFIGSAEQPLITVGVEVPVVDQPARYTVTNLDGASETMDEADVPKALMDQLVGDLSATRRAP